MAVENLTRIARELVEAFNAGDRELFKQLVTPDVTYEEIGTQRTIQGADAWIQAWEQWKRAFPDVTGTINNALSCGKVVLQEITWVGTHSGPLLLPTGTVRPSGQQVTTLAAFICDFEGDKIKQCRHYFDMLQMIGAIPEHVRTHAG